LTFQNTTSGTYRCEEIFTDEVHQAESPFCFLLIVLPARNETGCCSATLQVAFPPSDICTNFIAL
jgi:hypothetical protein